MGAGWWVFPFDKGFAGRIGNTHIMQRLLETGTAYFRIRRGCALLDDLYDLGGTGHDEKQSKDTQEDDR